MEVKRVELWYPRLPGHADTLEIGLVDVRAADEIYVRYDFERDGWVVLQHVHQEMLTWGDEIRQVTRIPQEVAFVPAWGVIGPYEIYREGEL